MNNKRRKELHIAFDYLKKASEIVQKVFDQEQDALSNWPENLQESDRYYEAEEICNNIEDLYYELQESCEMASKLI